MLGNVWMAQKCRPFDFAQDDTGGEAGGTKLIRSIDKNSTAGTDGLFFAYNGIHVHDNTVLAGVDRISDDDIKLHKDVEVTGVVYSTHRWK